MPKKFSGGNSKALAAKEKKASHASEVQAKKQRDLEAKEAKEWEVGAKHESKKDLENKKREEKLARQRENELLLAKEEASIKSAKPSSAIKKKKDDAGLSFPVRGQAKTAVKKETAVASFQETKVEEFSASNIDDALDLLDNVNVSSSGPPASGEGMEKHPERRAKAAFKAYEERELPLLKQEFPGLRLSQLKQILFKNWQKSPENPFNQAHANFDAKAEVIREYKAAEAQKKLDNLRIS